MRKTRALTLLFNMHPSTSPDPKQPRYPPDSIDNLQRQRGQPCTTFKQLRFASPYITEYMAQILESWLLKPHIEDLESGFGWFMSRSSDPSGQGSVRFPSAQEINSGGTFQIQMSVGGNARILVQV
ncbi:hypothetical protein NPIL_365361 [Nephila pilipes]|uniref:Uncharacterized protein n=1 Tax=Nephila pilipes TaxID=299642 RepID=A0A8X6QMA3_NEPPI|nr:hypothetical protein NPIL_365361 [Nephila pilipes]